MNGDEVPQAGLIDVPRGCGNLLLVHFKPVQVPAVLASRRSEMQRGESVAHANFADGPALAKPNELRQHQRLIARDLPVIAYLVAKRIDLVNHLLNLRLEHWSLADIALSVVPVRLEPVPEHV